MKNKKTVCFIGNDSSLLDANDGQTLKVRLYKALFKNEDVNFSFINLYKWEKHFFSIIHQIKKAVAEADIIFLMSGPRGSRFLIPLINHFNKTKKKRFVCSMIGRGTLSIPIDKHNIDSDDFFLNQNYHQLKDNYIKKHLSKIDSILLETDILTTTYSRFYGLNNCHTICNFRNISLRKKSFNNNQLVLGYFSRVCRYKGIFNLLEAFDILRKKGLDISLNIYGKEEFSKNDQEAFRTYLEKYNSIHFFGPKQNEVVLQAMLDVDCFVFPSICSEGMPGSVIESLIIGLPLISSDFTQSKNILKDEYDSLIYKSTNVMELVEKIERIYKNRELLRFLGRNAIESGKRFTLEFNKKPLFEQLFL